MIALVDCNNFYASCERLFRPDLQKRPVVVLSNNDGCVIARSNEAKEQGIEMGAPAFMIREKLQETGAVIFSSNYRLYGDLSMRVMTTLSDFVPAVEVYSVDEAFANLSGVSPAQLATLADSIRTTIGEWIGIPVTVGIAPTKTLAKMANRFAKKMRKDTGFFCADTEDKIKTLRAYTAIGDVWGIGNQHKRRLLQHNVKTAADFVQMNPAWIRKYMTVVGERMLNELNGIPSIVWNEPRTIKKAICTARSFGQLLSDKKDIREAVANYAHSCAMKLRKQNSCANEVYVFLQTNTHREQDKQLHASVKIHLPVPCNSSNQLIKAALEGLDIIFKPGYRFKKAGVMVMDLVPEQTVQLNLFESVDKKKEDPLMRALDNISVSYSKDAIRFASQGYQRKWKLKQELLSPCYTTNWEQLYTIR